MASETTVVTIADTNWNYLPTLVAAARVSASQPPLPETYSIGIRYTADKDNVARIFFIGDPLSGGEGKPLLAEETFEDMGYSGCSASLRKWYIKGSVADKLEVAMVS